MLRRALAVVLVAVAWPRSLSAEDPRATTEKRRAEEACKSLAGYERLRKYFVVEKAALGNINMMPESLFVQLRSTGPELLDAIWWWSPLARGRPKHDWDVLLRVVADARGAVAKHRWLTGWKETSSGRSLELHALGKGIGETDFELKEFILPVWREAGFAGRPSFSLLARRGDQAWATIYLGAEDPRALVTAVAHPDPDGPHWLDRLAVYFHPRCKPGNPSSRYVVVSPSGTWEMHEYLRCEP